MKTVIERIIPDRNFVGPQTNYLINLMFFKEYPDGMLRSAMPDVDSVDDRYDELYTYRRLRKRYTYTLARHIFEGMLDFQPPLPEKKYIMLPKDRDIYCQPYPITQWNIAAPIKNNKSNHFSFKGSNPWWEDMMRYNYLYTERRPRKMFGLKPTSQVLRRIGYDIKQG